VGRLLVRWLESGTRLEFAWIVFAILNLVAMLAIIELRFGQGWETVPFHFIYVSFTLLYGFRAWRGRATLAGIAFVTISTGAVTAFGIHRSWESPPEFTEVPLMSLMFEALAAERERDLERKSVFLSDASHELLTPITIGRGHLDLLRREQHPTKTDVDETSAIVLGELGRMERVISRLLLLESTDAAGRTVERVAAADLVTQTFLRWRGTADRDWQLGDAPPGAVAVDRDQIMLALDALVENAVQHTRPGGPIAIGAAADGGMLRIRIRDDGDGIPTEAQARVFDRFYRVDGARNRRHGGVGLGLAIVKAIVESHGGRVSVSSRQGNGSTFEIALPGLRSAGDQPVPAAADGFDHGLGLEFAP
jgi:signal transduction histidine kinase